MPSRRSWDLWLSLEDFPRGFHTRISYRAVQRAAVVGVDPCRESRGSKGKTGPLEWTETSGGLWEWWHRRLTSSRLSCGERLLLRCNGNAQNSFPTKQGKNPSSRATRRKRGSSGCVRDPRASSRVETGMSGKFLSCSKGVKDLLEVPELRCD